jgi:acetylornithine deacetylase/succinyl-diaminopimelate desuccinylase-like protein
MARGIAALNAERRAPNAERQTSNVHGLLEDVLLEEFMNQLDDLIEFLRFPSVSADAQFKPQVEACADWLMRRLQKVGLQVQKFPTAGHPIVVARNEHKAGRKTVLIYGHYDVQPPDPLELWDSPPFEPAIRGDKIFARGSTDNKGQILAHILGVEGALNEKGDLPVNLILLVEGEEEVGSPNLEGFLKEHRSALQTDVIAISDTAMVAPGIPTFSYCLRGILCLEVRLRGPSADLHSGIFGGSVTNPATVLSRLIAKLHDEKDHIAVPGFYDRVAPLEDWERQLWTKLPYTEDQWRATTGAPKLGGEEGYTFLERVWARPTAEVNGFASGYQGEGSKTIIPSRARAKLSFRLVPNQDPAELRAVITNFLKTECPDTVEMEIIDQQSGRPYIVKPDSVFGKAAQRALARTFDKPVAFIREGGSIPITQTCKEVLGVDTLLLGLALPDCKAHSPNENFAIDNFYAGIRLNSHLLEEIAGAA